MSSIITQYICGKKGGTLYKDVIRPNFANKCPEGTVKCSSKTLVDNTICIEIPKGDAILN